MAIWHGSMAGRGWGAKAGPCVRKLNLTLYCGVERPIIIQVSAFASGRFGIGFVVRAEGLNPWQYFFDDIRISRRCSIC